MLFTAHKRLLLSFLAVVALAIPALGDVTISGTTTFAAIDGSALDDDHSANGVFTVNSNLTVLGTINCNDTGPGSSSACPMQFVVTGNLTLASGSAVFAENRSSGGNGGNITFTVGGNVLLQGTTVSLAGAIVSSAKTNDGNPAHGGDIVFSSGGTFTSEGGSIISSSAKDSNAGAISITSNGAASVGGNVLAGATRALTSTPYTGAVISGGGGHVLGGPITIKALTHSEPGLVITSSAIIASQGSDPGGNTVTLEGCNVQINGLVAALAKKNAGPRVVVRSGSTITIDSSTLATTDGAHRARIRADALNESATGYHVDLFAKDAITIIGPPTSSTLFSVSSNGGGSGNDDSGSVNVISTAGTITGSGNALQATGNQNDDRGGTITVSSKNDLTLNGATVDASGGSGGGHRAGGHINVRSYSGAVNWLAGVGDVRPVGSTAGVPAAQQGTISLTYCTTLSTAGTSFLTNGAPVGTFPTTAQTCSPAAPSLPSGESLPDCNDPPVANDDNYTVAEGGTLNVPAPGVLTNDVDPEGSPITATLVTGPAHASSFTFNANGSFNYVHDGSETTSDSFTYKANDGSLDSNIATVHITITPVNDPPVANDDSYSVNEDTALNVAAPGVLANDTDPDGPTAITILVSGPSHASSFALNPDGSFTYTGTLNYNGPDSFTYQRSDGSLVSNIATVHITVNAVNDAPVAVNDAYSTNEDTPLNVAAPGVLGNDSDVDSPSITAVLVTGPLHAASFNLNADGSFNYTPALNYNGSDSFTYNATDGSLSSMATVSLTINPVNDAPVAVNDAYSTNEDTNLTVAAPGVLGNDSDVDSSITAVLVTGPLHAASFALNPDGSFSYTPNPNYNGSDSFTYQATDGSLSSTATVSLTINPVNDAPVAVNDSYSTNEDTTLNVAAPGVLGNDSDVDSSITAVLVTGPLHAASFNLNADGSFNYTPALNYNGSDSFTYSATDGSLSSTATVSLTINPVNDAPVAVADAYSTNEDTTLNVAAPGVLGNDSDVDSPSITAVLVSAPPNAASFALAADGSFVYTPNANFSGIDSFTYKANDGSADSNTVTVTITVNAINDAPVITAPASASTNEDTTLTFSTISVNDVDAGAGNVTVTLNVSNGTLTLASISGLTVSGNGSASITATGTLADLNAALNGLAYAPNGNYNGSDSLAITANDNGNTGAGGPLGDSKTVAITVNAVNDAPVNSVPGTQTVAEDTNLVFSTSNGNAITTSDVDAGGNSVQVTLTATNGTLATGSTLNVTVTGNGTSTVTIVGAISDINAALEGTTFTPNLNFNGPASISMTTDDLGNTGSGGAQTDTDSITINVTAVNDAPVANNDGPYNVTTGGSFTLPAPGVLANDTDVDSPTLTAILVSGPAHATFFVLNSDGSFTYTNDGTSGTDSFTYKANDGSLDSNVATVTLNVTTQPPVANQDNYIGVGNTELRVGLVAGAFPAAVVSGSVLDNDTDADTLHAALVVSAFDATSLNGGTVLMTPAGNFSYLPATGFTGVDTFHYSVTDGTNTTVGIVQITITERVWYVNNSGLNGTGRSSQPFNNLLSAQTASAVNDYIYVHAGAGTYAGGIVLKNNQKLIGNGVALVVSSYTLNGAGARPTIGTGVTLASGNLVTGLNVASAGLGIAGSLSNGGTISQVDVSGGSDGISLTSPSGTFTISTVVLTPGGAGLVISGGSATVNASGLTVTTTTGKGILGTAGTLNISGTSSVTSSAASAIDLTGMTLGVTLSSVNSSNDAIGIKLTNTTGSFTSNGGTISNMTTAGLKAQNATNISLSNMTFTNAATTNGDTAANCSNLVTGSNANCNAAIDLLSVSGASFTGVTVNGSTQIGINGQNVSGFSLINSEVRNAGNEAGESGVQFQNLTGTATLTNANIHNNAAHQMYVENLTGSVTMNVSGSTFSNSTSPTGGHGLFVSTRASAAATVSVSASTFSGNFGNGVNITGAVGASNNVTIDGSTFTNETAGINLQTINAANLTFNITNNPTFTGMNLQSINVARATPNTGTVTGTISGNAIGMNGVVGSACAAATICDGIDLRGTGASGSLQVTVTNNAIHGVTGGGLSAQATNGASSLQLKVATNSFTDPDITSSGNAIFVQSGAVSTDTTSVCADIFSNTITGLWDQNASGTSIRVRNRFAGTTFRLPGYAGAGNSTAQVAAFLSLQNGGALASATINANVFAGGAACTTP